MKVYEVESSAMNQVAYEKNKLELIVWMKDGKRICYKDVPYETYKGLMASHSKGSFFNQQIRSRFSFDYV